MLCHWRESHTAKLYDLFNLQPSRRLIFHCPRLLFVVLFFGLKGNRLLDGLGRAAG
jgi:hypothetical protein